MAEAVFGRHPGATLVQLVLALIQARQLLGTASPAYWLQARYTPPSRIVPPTSLLTLKSSNSRMPEMTPVRVTRYG
jgi:hypothetical protein